MSAGYVLFSCHTIDITKYVYFKYMQNNYKIRVQHNLIKSTTFIHY